MNLNPKNKIVFCKKCVMSNQRPGKYQSRPDVGGQDMNLLKFFKTAQKVLEKENKQDEAFNFEQMVDWLQSGKRLPLTEEDVIKALGI